MIPKLRNILTLWKLKLMRASMYLSLLNTFMLLFLFSRQLYEINFISNNINFPTFIIVSYCFVVFGFLLLSELDWKYIFKTEQGFQAYRNPLTIISCFNSAYLLYKAKQEGKAIERVFEHIKDSYKMSGYEKEFLYFWEVLNNGIQNKRHNK